MTHAAAYPEIKLLRGWDAPVLYTCRHVHVPRGTDYSNFRPTAADVRAAAARSAPILQTLVETPQELKHVFNSLFTATAASCAALARYKTSCSHTLSVPDSYNNDDSFSQNAELKIPGLLKRKLMAGLQKDVQTLHSVYSTMHREMTVIHVPIHASRDRFYTSLDRLELGLPCSCICNTFQPGERF